MYLFKNLYLNYQNCNKITEEYKDENSKQIGALWLGDYTSA
jgi:hypothetical protein